jgi:hypothetical protein
MTSIDRDAADRLLSALARHLSLAGARVELVVIGGTALIALGLLERATRDVDVVALLVGGSLVSATPLPRPLVEARDRVAADFGLDEQWLNGGPAGLLRWGLPEGFLDRLTARSYGDWLTVHFASRFDLIHFKLYALVDQGPGRHEADLLALSPQPDELLAAASWARTHDPSDGFARELTAALRHLGVENADPGAP